MNIRQTGLKFVPITFFSLMAGLISEPARADHLNFTLFNDSSQTIVRLYISPARENNWRANILREVVNMGESTRITFPGQSPASPCVWDVKAILTDGAESLGRFNLCKIDTVNVRD
jgi:hypothetical protein